MKKLFDLQDFKDKSEISEIVEELSIYPKYKSLIVMAVSGLPVPKTIIISSLDEETRKKCEETISKWGVREVSIRTDKVGGSVFAPSTQGCKLKDIWSEVNKYFNDGYLPMIISAGDIFHNVFSANIIVDPNNPESFYFESVGPGFCASDISKRDIVNESGVVGIGESGDIGQYRVVDDGVYRQQVNLMKKNQIKKQEEKTGKNFDSEMEAENWVTEFLENNKALILNNLTCYKPLAHKYIHKLKSLFPSMLMAGKLMGYDNEKYIVSMAFVLENKKEAPYFFDIHPYMGYKNG